MGKRKLPPGGRRYTSVVLKAQRMAKLPTVPDTFRQDLMAAFPKMEFPPLRCGDANVPFSFDQGAWCFVYCAACTRVTWDVAPDPLPEHSTWHRSAAELVAAE